MSKKEHAMRLSRNASMRKNEWNEIADLFEQCAYMADESLQTHSRNACEYVRDMMVALAAEATERSL